MLQLPKTSRGFKNWLREKNPRSIPCSGENNIFSCPLDVYLREKYKVKVWVRYETTSIDEQILKNPTWMRKAVDIIDSYNNKWYKITTSRLLKLMEGI